MCHVCYRVCSEEAGGGGLVDKLLKVQELLARSDDISREQVAKKIGNNVSALGSVPTAIYVFLRALQPIEGIEVGAADHRGGLSMGAHVGKHSSMSVDFVFRFRLDL